MFRNIRAVTGCLSGAPTGNGQLARSTLLTSPEPIFLALTRPSAYIGLLVCCFPCSVVKGIPCHVALAFARLVRDFRPHVQLQLVWRAIIRGVWLARIPAGSVATNPATVDCGSTYGCNLGFMALASFSSSRMDQRYRAGFLLHLSWPGDGHGVCI